MLIVFGVAVVLVLPSIGLLYTLAQRSLVEEGERPPTLNARVRRAMREARTEAVIVLALEVALFAGLAFVDKAKGWGIIDLPWWAWMLLAAPAAAAHRSCSSSRRARS